MILITSIDTTRINQKLDDGYIVAVAGFQGINSKNDITTLGRGGSDTTAVALAVELKADECQIYTDVDGVYTCDPRIDSSAKRLDQLSYEEMLEMSEAGSKVLKNHSVQFASRYKIPLRVLSSLTKNPKGTLILEGSEMLNENIVSGVASSLEAKIALLGVPDEIGVAASIIKPLSENNIVIDDIIQSVSKSSETNNFAFTVSSDDFEKTENIILRLRQDGKLNFLDFKFANPVAKISLVGIGIKSQPGIFYKMLKTLSEEGINIEMINATGIKISVIIQHKYAELAVRAIHKAFNLGEKN